MGGKPPRRAGLIEGEELRVEADNGTIVDIGLDNPKARMCWESFAPHPCRLLLDAPGSDGVNVPVEEVISLVHVAGEKDVRLSAACHTLYHLLYAVAVGIARAVLTVP